MRISKRGAIFLPALFIFLVLGFTQRCAAQDIILNDLQSNPVNLSSYKGRPTILFFLTTWCPHCRTEIKTLNQLYPQIKKEGIFLFAVNIGEQDYKVQKFFKDYALTFRVLLDKTGQAADKYEVIGIPTYVLLGKEGRVVASEFTLPADYRSLLSK